MSKLNLQEKFSNAWFNPASGVVGALLVYLVTVGSLGVDQSCLTVHDWVPCYLVVLQMGFP